MDRVIKFRVWDGNHNRFIYPDTIEIGAGIEYQQYTGLKDKNGTEIYEGDILKHPNWKSEYKCKKCGHNPKKSQNFLVIWQNKWHHDYGYTTVARCAIEVICGFDVYELDEAEKFEVIGNKFQNPELLDQ